MFLVIELQRLSDVSVANQVFSYIDRTDAEVKYHALLSVAAGSSVPVHSVVMITDDGTRIKGESYRHPTPDPEE